jgi:hypothetical protein
MSRLTTNYGALGLYGCFPINRTAKKGISYKVRPTSNAKVKVRGTGWVRVSPRTEIVQSVKGTKKAN